MLSCLTIHNYKLIDRLECEFNPGLSVLTGETGAGKSIILNALAVLLGASPGRDIFRDKKRPVSISAVFSLPETPAFRQQLEELGLIDEADGAEELILRRQLALNRRGGLSNRIYLNDQPTTNRTVTTLAAGLIEFVDQHQQQQLRDPGQALKLLDLFGNLEQEREVYRELYKTCRRREKEFEEWRQELAEAARQMDYYIHQLDKLNQVELDPEEEKTLRERQRQYQQLGRLRDLAREVERLTYTGENALLDNCYRLQETILELGRRDASAPRFEEGLTAVIDTLQDLHQECSSYLEKLEVDEATIEETETQLAALEQLKRRFATDVEGLIRLREELSLKVSSWENREHEEAERQKEVEARRQESRQAAAELSHQRRQQAEIFGREVSQVLKELHLPAARFRVEVRETELNLNGADEVTFLFSANPGEEPAPLDRVASGGELSRLLLALKSVVAGRYQVPTLIFDEVDTGLGGRTAAAVGRKVAALADRHQVLTVTHLPQVAAFADHHFVIAKTSRSESPEVEGAKPESLKTAITLEAIDPGDESRRIRELARMGSGARISRQAEEHAHRLRVEALEQKTRNLEAS